MTSYGCHMTPSQIKPSHAISGRDSRSSKRKDQNKTSSSLWVPYTLKCTMSLYVPEIFHFYFVSNRCSIITNGYWSVIFVIRYVVKKVKLKPNYVLVLRYCFLVILRLKHNVFKSLSLFYSLLFLYGTKTKHKYYIWPCLWMILLPVAYKNALIWTVRSNKILCTSNLRCSRCKIKQKIQNRFRDENRCNYWSQVHK